MVRALWLLLTVTFAGVVTTVLFTKEREYQGFSYASCTIRIDTGEHGGGSKWDRSIGFLPYAYYRRWSKPNGDFSRWELVQFKRETFGLSMLIAALSWCPVGLSVCRCFHPSDAKLTGPPVESKPTEPDDGEQNP